MGAAILFGFALLIVRWRRKRTSQLLNLLKDNEENVAVINVEFYAELQRNFARLGFIRPSHIPAMTWVQSLNLSKECVISALYLSSKYYEIRYGRYRPSRSERIVLLQKVRELDMLLGKESQ